MSSAIHTSPDMKKKIAEKIKNSWCKINGCRYPNTHIATGHRCGKCNKFGHGQVECGKPVALRQLADITKNDSLDKMMYCSSNGCTKKHNHTIEAHICSVCSKRHPKEECLISPVDALPYNSSNIWTKSTAGNFTPSFDSAISYLGSKEGKIYTIQYAGMGCYLYIKRSSTREPLYGYFMHSDSWGQYDPDGVGDQATLNLFLEGFIKV